ncbi:MAG TPA: YqgE/AlgH family protein [Candidatus Dormibacteraeota bacterium]|jgi:putative transcriptional regulator|nr:YqgE/AlgH family protein [Candidatus Dormibacteraeota bacterium]
MADASLVGRLLVATPQLGDPNFVRTVLLVVQHRDEGAVGVVLNRPSEVAIEQVLPNWAGLASGPQVVFRGGPVSPEAALCLARVSGGEEPMGWKCLEVPGLEDLGLVDLDAPPVMLAYKLAGLRVFAGYAGWDAGQLENEIGDGSWYLLPAIAADPFSEDPRALWQRVLRRQGGQLAMLATMPDDPALN